MASRNTKRKWLDESEQVSTGDKSPNTFQLIRLSSVVCGIEFCYAAETVFVSPILLKMGLPVTFTTAVYAISPALGFILVPIIGSLSDRCTLSIGRRRPFIVLMSLGIFLGLILVPYGKALGQFLGDTYTYSYSYGYNQSINGSGSLYNVSFASNVSNNIEFMTDKTNFHNPWGLFFTIIGVALLDFNCDGCQSPSRTYMLDVCAPEDQANSLTIFTIFAGFGGSVGFILGYINWEQTDFGDHLGGHVPVVFGIVGLIYFVCLLLTVTSVKEVPLKEVGTTAAKLQCKQSQERNKKFHKEDSSRVEEVVDKYMTTDYGTLDQRPLVGAVIVHMFTKIPICFKLHFLFLQ